MAPYNCNRITAHWRAMNFIRNSQLSDSDTASKLWYTGLHCEWNEMDRQWIRIAALNRQLLLQQMFRPLNDSRENLLPTLTLDIIPGIIMSRCSSAPVYHHRHLLPHSLSIHWIVHQVQINSDELKGNSIGNYQSSVLCRFVVRYSSSVDLGAWHTIVLWWCAAASSLPIVVIAPSSVRIFINRIVCLHPHHKWVIIPPSCNRTSDNYSSKFIVPFFYCR